MDFGQAITRVVSGSRATRGSWGASFIVRDGDLIRKVDGTASGVFTPSQSDMLADDWRFGEPANLVTDPAFDLPFRGDAFPGSNPNPGGPDDPRVPEVEDTTLAPPSVGGPSLPHAVIVPPGGFVVTVNDPHAAENRDPDAA